MLVQDNWNSDLTVVWAIESFNRGLSTIMQIGEQAHHVRP